MKKNINLSNCIENNNNEIRLNDLWGKVLRMRMIQDFTDMEEYFIYGGTEIDFSIYNMFDEEYKALLEKFEFELCYEELNGNNIITKLKLKKTKNIQFLYNTEDK